MHKTTPRFWKLLDQLPDRIRKQAKEKFDLLKTDPAHPSLHFKKVGKVWSARVSEAHRAIAVPDGKDFIWIWVGKHDDYERMIGELP